jgi:AraC-like DNA-binding protein
MIAAEPGEVISFSRPEDLAGTEVLRAERSRRLWRWHHTTISIATPIAFDGAATYQYRGRLHTARGDGLCVMEPGEVHVTREVTAPATFRVLFVPREVVERAADELGLSARAVHFGDSVLPDGKLVRAFQRLHASLELGLATPLERQARFADALRLLLERTQARRTRGREPGGGRRPHLRRARELIDAHAASALGLDDVATVAGVSRFALVRLFLKELGVPPHAYKLLRQVELARAVLRQGAGLDEGARRAGFFDVSHLNRHFKRIVGVTPGAYARGVVSARGGASSRGGREKAISSHLGEMDRAYVAPWEGTS